MRKEEQADRLRRSRRAAKSAAIAVVAVVSFTGLTQATTYTFDSSGMSPTAPVDGSGPWDNTSSLWSTAGADTTYSNGTNGVIFGSNNGAAGAITLSNQISVSTITFNAATSGNYVLSGSTLTSTGAIYVRDNVNATINSAFTGSFGQLNILGAGVLSLGGASDFSSPILNLNYGATISVTTANSGSVAGPLGKSTGGVRIYGGTVIITGASAGSQGLRIYDEGATIDNESTTGAVVIGASATNGTGTNSINPVVTARTITFTGNSTYNGSFNGQIIDSAPTAGKDITSVLKSGTGTWYLTGTTSTYSGATTIANGTLGIGTINQLPPTASPVIGTAGTNNTAAFDLSSGAAASYGQTFSGLSAIGTDLTKDFVVNNDTKSTDTATLTVNPDTATTPVDSTFGGIIKNGSAGKIALTKSGSHTFSLTGNSTYTGATTIAGGTLSIAGSIASTAISLNSSAANASLALLSATSLSGSSGISVTTGSFVPTAYLDYNGNLTITSLVINGTTEATGVYSASNQPADDSSLFASDSGFAGTLTVAPEPASAVLTVLGTFAFLPRRRRRSIGQQHVIA